MHWVQESYNFLVDAMDAFGKYVPRRLVQSLLSGAIKPALGMVEQHVAVAFMDMENFTTICETMQPHEIVKVASPCARAEWPVGIWDT